jgi:exopolysaccharide production protein ExoZ
MVTPTPAKNRGMLFSIQYLRGVAAGLVLITHSILHPMDSVPIPIVRIGGLGVALFFVISGFIMVTITGDRPFDRVEFYRRRAARVVPLYWIATTAVAAIALLLPTVLKNTEFDLRQYLFSLLFVPHFRANGELVPLLKLGWTLNLEMFFYLVFGSVAFLRNGARVAIVSTLFVALALAGTRWSFDNALLRQYTAFDMASFCIGMWVGTATLGGRDLLPGAALKVTASAIALMLIASSFLINPEVPFTPWVTLAQAVGSGIFIIVGLGVEHRLPQVTLLRLFGDASYSIYLVHMYFVGAAVVVFHRVAPGSPFPLVVLGGLVGGAIGGLLTYRFVERPIMNYFHRQARERKARKIAALAGS